MTVTAFARRHLLGLSVSVIAVCAVLPFSAFSQEYSRIPKSRTDFDIYPFGQCWMASEPGKKDTFVPYRTAAEWQAFLAHKPAGMAVDRCCRSTNVTACGSTVSLPLARATRTATAQVPQIVEGQCYRVSCQSASGNWQTIQTVATSDLVLAGPNPYRTGAFVVKYAVTGVGTASIDFKCQTDGSWLQTTSNNACPYDPTPAALVNVAALNCWGDETGGPGSASGSFYNSDLCKKYGSVGLPPGTWIIGSPSYQIFGFNQGFGRGLAQCSLPTRC